MFQFGRKAIGWLRQNGGKLSSLVFSTKATRCLAPEHLKSFRLAEVAGCREAMFFPMIAGCYKHFAPLERTGCLPWLGTLECRHST